METTPRKNKGLATGLGVLQVFIGLGAVGGGLALEFRKNTDFSQFALSSA